MSRFNVLMHGEPDEAANALGEDEADEGELRAAIVNALRRIALLERQVERLRMGATP